MLFLDLQILGIIELLSLVKVEIVPSYSFAAPFQLTKFWLISPLCFHYFMCINDVYCLSVVARTNLEVFPKFWKAFFISFTLIFLFHKLLLSFLSSRMQSRDFVWFVLTSSMKCKIMFLLKSLLIKSLLNE